MHIYILATLDTKGLEAEFLRSRLNELGMTTTLVDAGCLGEPTVRPDITREAVFEAANTTLEAVRQQGDRGVAIGKASFGVSTLLLDAHLRDKNIAGVISLGGSAG